MDEPLAFGPVGRRDADTPQRSGLGSSAPGGQNRVPRRSIASRLNYHGPRPPRPTRLEQYLAQKHRKMGNIAHRTDFPLVRGPLPALSQDTQCHLSEINGPVPPYFAYSTARTSRSKVTLISPGYVISASILLATSRAIRIALESFTLFAFTITRTSRPAWIA